MKKHIRLTILVLLTVVFGSIAAVRAEILPPRGEGQIGLQAVVLCESLTLREAPRDDAGILGSLDNGSCIIVSKQADGWAECFVSDAGDAGPAGWVKSDYLAIDPAWYRADAATPVYAWNDTSAPKVGLLDKDTTLPVLKDDGEWLVVGLRGATGWIRK